MNMKEVKTITIRFEKEDGTVIEDQVIGGFLFYASERAEMVHEGVPSIGAKGTGLVFTKKGMDEVTTHTILAMAYSVMEQFQITNAVMIKFLKKLIKAGHIGHGKPPWHS